MLEELGIKLLPAELPAKKRMDDDMSDEECVCVCVIESRCRMVNNILVMFQIHALCCVFRAHPRHATNTQEILTERRAGSSASVAHVLRGRSACTLCK